MDKQTYNQNQNIMKQAHVQLELTDSVHAINDLHCILDTIAGDEPVIASWLDYQETHGLIENK